MEHTITQSIRQEKPYRVVDFNVNLYAVQQYRSKKYILFYDDQLNDPRVLYYGELSDMENWIISKLTSSL